MVNLAVASVAAPTSRSPLGEGNGPRHRTPRQLLTGLLRPAMSRVRGEVIPAREGDQRYNRWSPQRVEQLAP